MNREIKFLGYFQGEEMYGNTIAEECLKLTSENNETTDIWDKKIKEEKLMILDMLRKEKVDIQIYYQICGIIMNIIYYTKEKYHIEDESEESENDF